MYNYNYPNYGYQQPNYIQPYNPSPQIQPTYMPKGNMRIVNDFNSITANEIPMDGNIATFVKDDRSEIQIREWSSDGTIKTTSYLPQVKEIKPQAGDSNGFDSRFDEIKEHLNRLEDAIAGLKRKESKNGQSNIKSDTE